MFYTFKGIEVAARDADACGLIGPKNYICTRTKAHTDDHVAHVFEESPSGNSGAPVEEVDVWPSYESDGGDDECDEAIL